MGRTSAEWDTNKVKIDASKAADNSVYAREIWNGAIEAAAKRAEQIAAPIVAEEIRKLKK
jgi:hypothetical protein